MSAPPAIPDQSLLLYLSRPGGQREGPYTLEQVNLALTEGQYTVADYWAWYDGLADWVPLHSIPGVSSESAEDVPGQAGRGTANETVFVTAEAQPEVLSTQSEVVPTEAEPVASAPVGNSPESSAPSGLPFTALEQIFTLTTGDGQAASRSPVTISLLQQVIGEDWTTIREVVPRDVIAKCAVVSMMAKGAATPPLVWRAMTAFKPLLLQQAKDGLYRICVRTFHIESGDVVSVFLFYNKQKLN